MKVQEFSRDSFQRVLEEHPEMKRSFYSEIYNQAFPLKRGLVVKLDPIRREDVGRVITDFNRTNGASNSNFRDHPYSFNPDEYFLFRYRVPTDQSQTSDDIHIRFRTLSQDKLVDDFLECFQEASLVRFCCDTQGLVIPDEPLKKAHALAYRKSLDLVNPPTGMLRYMKEGVRKEWIRDSLIHVFDAFYLMKLKGYDPKKVVSAVRQIEISPDKEKDPKIWENALDLIEKTD